MYTRIYENTLNDRYVLIVSDWQM